MLDEGTVKAGLLFRKITEEKYTGGSTTINFISTGRIHNRSNRTTGSETISQSLSQEILIQRLERSGTGMQISLPVDARLRYLYNPDMKRMNFMIPGLVAIILQIQALLLTAFAIVRERSREHWNNSSLLRSNHGNLCLGRFCLLLLLHLSMW